MTKIKLTITFILISWGLFSQDFNHTKEYLKKSFIELPDSVFNNELFKLNRESREVFWKLYENVQYETREGFVDIIFGKFDLFMKNSIIDVKALVDKQNQLIRISDLKSDAIPSYDIKMFQNGNNPIIAITLKYYDFATTINEMVVFYEKTNGRLKNISKQILKSFNYYTDNYSSSSIDILNKSCNCDLKIDGGSNKGLLYTFSNSDTVIITENFFGYFYNGYPDPGLDTTYFDGEFYTKKYIMENGKLRLAE